MKFINKLRKFIDRIQDIDLDDIVCACLLLNVVVGTVVAAVLGVAFILYVVSVIAMAFTSAGGAF